jgi:hypothetical protein
MIKTTDTMHHTNQKRGQDLSRSDKENKNPSAVTLEKIFKPNKRRPRNRYKPSADGTATNNTISQISCTKGSSKHKTRILKAPGYDLNTGRISK